jgi:hypothetical protein
LLHPGLESRFLCHPDSGVVSAVTELSSESVLCISMRCILGYEFQ